MTFILELFLFVLACEWRVGYIQGKCYAKSIPGRHFRKPLEYGWVVQLVKQQAFNKLLDGALGLE